MNDRLGDGEMRWRGKEGVKNDKASVEEGGEVALGLYETITARAPSLKCGPLHCSTQGASDDLLVH